MLGLLIMAYTISLTLTDLTGGGEQFLMEQALGGKEHPVDNRDDVAAYGVYRLFLFIRIAGWQLFYSDTGNRGLLGKICALLLVQQGIIAPENISYVMLIGMAAFLVAVVRTPITAILLITEITGHFEVFYPSIVVGGLTYYFTELLEIKAFQRHVL